MIEKRLETLRTTQMIGLAKKTEAWKKDQEIKKLKNELHLFDDYFRDIDRVYRQFKREDEVERFKDEYVKTLEITHELVDQLGLGFI